MTRWSLIDSGFQSSAFNMACDEAIFRKAVEDPDFIPTLRVYGFRRPAITYGYSQKIARHWLEDPFYESSRRITGGGLVFHGKDMTYSFVGTTHLIESFRSLRNSYRVFHEVVKEAFERIKIKVDFSLHVSSDKPAKNLCFLSPVKDDLLFQGKKIAGAAQKRAAGFFLHQGSVNFRVFLKEDADYLPFFERFKSAFLDCFKDYFQVDFVIQSWSNDAAKSSNVMAPVESDAIVAHH